MTTPTEPVDLSHLSDAEFHTLAPQGYHGVGDCHPDPERPADEELDNIYWDESWRAGADDPSAINEVGLSEFRLIARAVLARFGAQR